MIFEVSREATQRGRISSWRYGPNATEVTQISEQLVAGCHFATPHVALATTICVKMVEQTLFKHILRKVAPIKPSTQLCHEFAFVVHRLRRISLAAETCRKCIDVGRQRANAGQLDRRHRATVGVDHHLSPLSRGKSSVAEDSRIMPSRQRSTSIQAFQIKRISSDRCQIARNNPALGIMPLMPSSA